MEIINIREDFYLEVFDNGDVAINQKPDLILVRNDELRELIEELQKLI